MRVVIAGGLVRLLAEAGIDVAAEVGTGDALLAAVTVERPDVAFVAVLAL